MDRVEMHAGGRAWLEAERATLQTMLATLKPEDVVAQMSLEGRLAEVSAALDTFPSPQSRYP